MTEADVSRPPRPSSVLEKRLVALFALLIVVLGVLAVCAQIGVTSATAPQTGGGTQAAIVFVLGLMAIPVALALLAARIIIRRTIAPLRDLTRVADEISTGNLDPRIDFGVPVNCWEIKDCQRTDCRAYQNLTEQCWYIDGTPCEGFEPRFPKKLEMCRTCEVYRAHRGDEIVQLADAFRHMANVLKASRGDLVASDDFQKRLIRNSFDGIVAADAEGVVTIFNRVAAQLTGYTHDEVVGRKDWRIFFENGLEKAMDTPRTWERVRRVRGFPPRDSAVKGKDGTRVDVRLSGISLYERGRHIGRVFFFQDQREVHRLREELIRSERLAATGQAAASISHSLRNILDGAGGGLYVFKHGRRVGDQNKMDTGLGMIERNVDIISRLVKDLLNFAKARTPEYEEVSPRALVDEVLRDVGPGETDRIELVADVAEGAGPVSLDPHAFRQCLGNLVRNAVEAIPAGQRGTVRVGFETTEDRVVFTVSDDGVGMSPETVEKVRGGMYSTKGSKGTGLGLLVIQKIVGEHRGHLTIRSEEGQGSTFRIDLPAAAPDPGPADAGSARSRTPAPAAQAT